MASQIIEQVIMEQPKKHRPVNMIVNEKYIAFGQGFEYNGKASSSNISTSNNSSITVGSKKGSLKQVRERIYFNSLVRSELLQKRDWYIVQLIGENELFVKRFYTRKKQKAEKFIDAINFYISNANKIESY